MKWLIIIGFIIVLLVGGYFIVSSLPKDISVMNDEEFKEYNLKQSEVKALINNEPITQTTITPFTSFNKENYDILVAVNPSCAGKINFGQTIKTATFYTPTREIGAIWLLKPDEKGILVCAVSRNKQN